MATAALLQVKSLACRFPVSRGFARHRGWIRAVDGVSLALYPGETLALVGESGCGKSTLARMLVGLQRPTSGRVLYRGADLWSLPARELRRLRREIQVVFQDPYSSLNPRLRVGSIVGEPLVIHGLGTARERQERVAELLQLVGLKADDAHRHPHQFSGGQRQRIGIARALALNPRLLVCDEPVSALDVSVRAQILNLLQDLQRQLGLSILLITHDLGVVGQVCDRVAVMYLGQIVESGDVARVFAAPGHPYTRALLSAVPVPDPARPQPELLVTGELPSPVNPPPGCRFHPRCPVRVEQCSRAVPVPVSLASDHWAACHLCTPNTEGKDG